METQLGQTDVKKRSKNVHEGEMTLCAMLWMHFVYFFFNLSPAGASAAKLKCTTCLELLLLRLHFVCLRVYCRWA